MSDRPDPSTLPAGEELDAIVLCASGWRWMRNRKRGLCSLWPPADDGGVWRHWRPDNWSPTSHEPFVGWPMEAERFSDWKRGSASEYRKPGPEYVEQWTRSGIPSPSTRPDDFAAVCRHLETLGWYGGHNVSPPTPASPRFVHWWFKRVDPDSLPLGFAEATDPDELVAGCRAALAAVGWKGANE